MKKSNNKRHEVYDVLDRLDQFKQAQANEKSNLCPVYSPPQACVGARCIWYDAKQHQCWVLNPRPQQAKA